MADKKDKKPLHEREAGSIGLEPSEDSVHNGDLSEKESGALSTDDSEQYTLPQETRDEFFGGWKPFGESDSTSNPLSSEAKLSLEPGGVYFIDGKPYSGGKPLPKSDRSLDDLTPEERKKIVDATTFPDIPLHELLYLLDNGGLIEAREKARRERSMFSLLEQSASMTPKEVHPLDAETEYVWCDGIPVPVKSQWCDGAPVPRSKPTYLDAPISYRKQEQLSKHLQNIFPSKPNEQFPNIVELIKKYDSSEKKDKLSFFITDGDDHPTPAERLKHFKMSEYSGEGINVPVHVFDGLSSEARMRWAKALADPTLKQDAVQQALDDLHRAQKALDSFFITNDITFPPKGASGSRAQQIADKLTKNIDIYAGNFRFMSGAMNALPDKLSVHGIDLASMEPEENKNAQVVDEHYISRPDFGKISDPNIEWKDWGTIVGDFWPSIEYMQKYGSPNSPDESEMPDDAREYINRMRAVSTLEHKITSMSKEEYDALPQATQRAVDKFRTLASLPENKDTATQKSTNTARGATPEDAEAIAAKANYATLMHLAGEYAKLESLPDATRALFANFRTQLELFDVNNKAISTLEELTQLSQLSIDLGAIAPGVSKLTQEVADMLSKDFFDSEELEEAKKRVAEADKYFDEFWSAHSAKVSSSLEPLVEEIKKVAEGMRAQIKPDTTIADVIDQGKADSAKIPTSVKKVTLEIIAQDTRRISPVHITSVRDAMKWIRAKAYQHFAPGEDFDFTATAVAYLDELTSDAFDKSTVKKASKVREELRCLEHAVARSLNVPRHMPKEGIYIIDLGCGDGSKAREVLAQLSTRYSMSYVAVDISQRALQKATATIEQAGYVATSVYADFNHLEGTLDEFNGKKMVLMLGKTFGNMPDYNQTLQSIALTMDTEDALFVGVELNNTIDETVAFYNNADNRNFIMRVGQTMGFPHHALGYSARFDHEHSDVMGELWVKHPTVITHGESNIHFRPHDAFQVLKSHKFTPDELTAVFSQNGFNVALVNMNGYAVAHAKLHK